MSLLLDLKVTQKMLGYLCQGGKCVLFTSTGKESEFKEAIKKSTSERNTATAHTFSIIHEVNPPQGSLTSTSISESTDIFKSFSVTLQTKNFSTVVVTSPLYPCRLVHICQIHQFFAREPAGERIRGKIFFPVCFGCQNFIKQPSFLPLQSIISPYPSATLALKAAHHVPEIL